MTYLGTLDTLDLGDAPGPAYTDWANLVQSIGGAATTWPFSSGIYAKFYGRPASRFTGAGYANAANRGYISPSATAQATANNQYIYVLAPDDVAAAAPQTMTAFQRAQNAIFTTGDRAASAAGLPSLQSIQDTLRNAGKGLAFAIVAGIATWAIINRIGKK